MTINTPLHPGEIIKEDCLAPLGLTVTAAAKWLGVSRNALSEVVNGHSGASPDMAIRLEKAGWSTAETWLAIQTRFDLAKAKRHADRIKVEPYPQLKPA